MNDNNNIIALPLIFNMFLFLFVGIFVFFFVSEGTEEKELRDSNYEMYLKEIKSKKYMFPKIEELGNYKESRFYSKLFRSSDGLYTRQSYSIMFTYYYEEYLSEKNKVFSNERFKFLNSNSLDHYNFYFPFFEFKINDYVFTIHLDYMSKSKHYRQESIDFNYHECYPTESFGMIGYNDKKNSVLYFCYNTKYSDDLYYFSNYFYAKSPLNCYLQWEKFVKSLISFEFFGDDCL